MANMSCTYTRKPSKQFGSRMWEIEWTVLTDDAAGTASGTTTETFSGLVHGAWFNPGSTAPTDDYDVTITTSKGYDVLGGNGANRDTANTEYVQASPYPLAISNETFALAVSNAGNAKSTVITLLVEAR